MLPNTSNGEGMNLEDRLRGLILNNANVNPVSHGHASPAPQSLEGHGNSSSTQILENQNKFSAPDGSSTLQASHKRPNQAQRRQMNFQLSIPIDHRPNSGTQAGRGSNFHGLAPNMQRSSGNHNNRDQIQQDQRLNQQQYSPRASQTGPGSPYSPRPSFHQGSQHSHSPMVNQQPDPSPPFQGHGQFQQPQHPNAYARPPPQNRQLYQPGHQNMSQRGRLQGQAFDEAFFQSSYLDSLVQSKVIQVGIDRQEEAEKDAFRTLVENACREAITEYEQIELKNQKFDPQSVELQCFGSMRSGFATKASDMDLALLTPKSNPAPDSPESLIPRLLEKKLLGLGYGARLLTKTRVPIIKLCQQPSTKLFSDLMEERLKWEAGDQAEDGTGENEATEENEEELEPAEASRNAGPKAETIPNDAPIGVSKAVTQYDKLSTLAQKEHQSLGDYHNSAKRYLRKLGGRDVTSSSPRLTDEEGDILNSVCRQFILGLAHKGLSLRLQTYQSIAPLFDPPTPKLLRSLQGIVTQAEGERLGMAWESRVILECTESRESEYREWVSSWRVLQGMLGTAGDPVAYNRQLYHAAEKLKKISSLQLLFLEQIQHEETVYYLARAEKIVAELRGKSQASNDEITPLVISQYIKGIIDPKIRSSLQKADLTGLTLQRVGIHHRALQLAADYEHALKSEYFNATCKEDVQRYIDLLRSLKIDSSSDGPSTFIDDALLVKIRNLPDPAEISLDKPRDRYNDHLEFPKIGVGIQCDINFSAQLAIHNTQLLRCYAASDTRVKSIILFVKHWAKTRGINTPYRGTLSSYGYVLMVLHYLVNVAQPFVCPNLQLVQKAPPKTLSPAEIEARTTCQGRDVRFWRNEAEIRNLAERKMLNHNHDSVGMLLRGFFEYYAQNGQMTTVHGRGFDWGREVLSLRTPGGILTKQEKNWVGAKTTFKENNEIRHRYLFAIEDPFELDHNVARTVTHNGIVNIRDEFRRSWRVIRSRGKPHESQEGGLLDPLSKKDGAKGLHELLDLLHGPAPKSEATNNESKGIKKAHEG